MPNQVRDCYGNRDPRGDVLPRDGHRRSTRSRSTLLRARKTPDKTETDIGALLPRLPRPHRTWPIHLEF